MRFTFLLLQFLSVPFQLVWMGLDENQIFGKMRLWFCFQSGIYVANPTQQSCTPDRHRCQPCLCGKSTACRSWLFSTWLASYSFRWMIVPAFLSWQQVFSAFTLTLEHPPNPKPQRSLLYKECFPSLNTVWLDLYLPD